MAVNPDFAGRTYPPSGPYAVDAALIAAFAAAVGSTDPVHTDAAAAQAAAVQAAARRFEDAGAIVEPLPPFTTREMADGIDLFWRLRSWLDISALPPYRRPVNTVFQNYALFPHMTVAQNISFGPTAR